MKLWATQLSILTKAAAQDMPRTRSYGTHDWQIYGCTDVICVQSRTTTPVIIVMNNATVHQQQDIWWSSMKADHGTGTMADWYVTQIKKLTGDLVT